MGGGGNVVPIILAKVEHTRKEIRRNTIVKEKKKRFHFFYNLIFRFKKALVLGLFVVWLLNVLWCYFILRAVPQEDGKLVQKRIIFF